MCGMKLLGMRGLFGVMRCVAWEMEFMGVSVQCGCVKHFKGVK